jgi:hypothetical protein
MKFVLKQICFKTKSYHDATQTQVYLRSCITIQEDSTQRFQVRGIFEYL